jgi:hypothetical protein
MILLLKRECYGKDNQITHPTYESILLHALQMAELDKDIIRDFKLKLLFESSTTTE